MKKEHTQGYTRTQDDIVTFGLEKQRLAEWVKEVSHGARCSFCGFLMSIWCSPQIARGISRSHHNFVDVMVHVSQLILGRV